VTLLSILWISGLFTDIGDEPVADPDIVGQYAEQRDATNP
jgi:hypothetical protein